MNDEIPLIEENESITPYQDKIVIFNNNYAITHNLLTHKIKWNEIEGPYIGGRFKTSTVYKDRIINI